MPEQPQPILNDLAVKILLLILGAIFSVAVGMFIERFKNRVLRLKKSVGSRLIAMSNEADFWGKVEILYNGSTVKNLYFINAQIINDTLKDAPKDMIVTFSLAPGAFFLREFGNVNNGDVQLGLKLEQAFLDKLLDVQKRWSEVPLENLWDNNALNLEVELVVTHRKFVMPILNRGKTATFDFLVASASTNDPLLNIGIYEPGVTLDWYESEAKHNRRLLWKNLIIIVIYLGMMFPVAKYSPSINWAVFISVAAGIPAYFLGLWLWMLLKYWKII